jgi:hypothetical protein
MPLEGTPVELPVPLPGADCDQQNFIKPKQTFVDGCPVLPKLQCHEVHMGQAARLLWNFKNPEGQIINLQDCVNNCSSTSSQNGYEFDPISTPPCGATLRMRELSGYDPLNDPIVELDVDIVDMSEGLVRAAQLPESIVRYPGIYLEEWAFFAPDGSMLFSNQCCTFIRAGLFGVNTNLTYRNFGPPTIEEIRISLRDNSGTDNVLLDDVEFDSAEIIQSVLRPLRYWNEIPPPLNPLLTTKTFPFKEIWLQGIQAYLFDIAANHYRRNQLAYSAGGMAIDDKNKEQQYIAASNRMMQMFQEAVKAKKIEINIGSFSSSLGSPYSGMFY